MSENVKCHVSPASLEDLDWIFRLQVETYSPKNAVARHRLERWFRSNPDGFSILTMNGRRVGHLTFIPMRAELVEDLVQGLVSEHDIHEGCLYTPAEKQHIRNLYVESVIVESATGHFTLPIKALTCLAHDFVPLIERICDPEKLENLYALAASGRGERLMKGLGFNVIQTGQQRMDGRALYAATFEALQARISQLYDRRMRTKRTSAT